MSANRRKLILILALVLVIAGVITYLLLPESLEAAGRAAIAATRSGDSDRLLRYVSEEEKKLLSLDSAKLRRFLADVVLPSLSGFNPDGDVNVTTESEYSVNVKQNLTHLDGRKVAISFQVHRTDDGPKVIPCTANLIGVLFDASLPSGQPYPTGYAKAAFFADTLAAFLPMLEKSGLEGFVRVEPGGGRMKLWRWSEFVQYNKDIAEEGRRK